MLSKARALKARLVAAPTGFEKDGEVADLVGYLVQQDSEGGQHAQARAGQEAATDGQAVGEVVDTVSQQVQVPSRLANRIACLFLFMSVLISIEKTGESRQDHDGRPRRLVCK